jgi:hypothetical protein
MVGGCMGCGCYERPGQHVSIILLGTEDERGCSMSLRREMFAFFRVTRSPLLITIRAQPAALPLTRSDVDEVSIEIT